MAEGKKRGRPRKDGTRDSAGRLIRLGKLTPPPDHIVEARKLYSFVTPTKGPDGRLGEIDQDICDGIGRLHALGLLDGHGYDPAELRDIGREWRNFYCTTLRRQGFKCGSYERMDKAAEVDRPANERMDRMDLALNGIERKSLLSLLVDPIVGSWPLGEEETPWVRAIVGEALLERKRIPPSPYRDPDGNDREMFRAAIRGLCLLREASLPNRWERAA